MRDVVVGSTPVRGIKRSVLLAWLLCLFCIISATVQVIIWLLNQSGPASLFDLVEAFGWGWALPVLFSALAALIIARQPSNRVGWLLMLPALVVAVPTERLFAEPIATLTPALWLLLWFDSWSVIPVLFPIFLIPLHFPTGRPPSAKWNWINWLALGLWIIFMALMAFGDTIGPLNYDWRLPNPIGFIPSDNPFDIIWVIGLVTVVLASVISLFVRYHRARVVERQQIKWLLYVGAFFIVFYTFVYVADFNQAGHVSGWVNLLFVLSILAFPVAIAIAILRYRLFDIDVIIRKTLVYGVLTALLAAVYFGSVVILQSLFAAISGEQSAVAIVISTLAIAALFNPLRRRIQGWIDRRFYRSKYDAAEILAAFAQTARDEVDLENLNWAILGVIESTVQPERATLWLRPVSKAWAMSPDEGLSRPVISPAGQKKDSL